MKMLKHSSALIITRIFFFLVKFKPYKVILLRGVFIEWRRKTQNMYH
jgi:hypothetical protein